MEPGDARVRAMLRELRARASELQTRSILAGAQAHDLSNLVAAAVHGIELLRVQADQPPDPATLDRLDEAMDRASELARGIAAQSADGEGEQDLELQDVAFDGVARAAGALGSSEGVAVVGDDGSHRVRGNRHQLIHVISALVESARRAGAQRVTVAVGADEIAPERSDRAWCSDRLAARELAFVEVRDDAPDRGHLPGDGPPWSDHEAVLRNVARRHGGGVEVESGTGVSTVRVLLPLDSRSGGSEG